MTGAPFTAEEDGDSGTARYSCVMCDGVQNLTMLELCAHMLTEEHRQGASVSLRHITLPAHCLACFGGVSHWLWISHHLAPLMSCCAYP